MTNQTEATCPFTTPEIGTSVKLACDHADCPAPHSGNPAFLAGWEAFFKGESKPEGKDGSRGWQAAKGHKAYRESYTWTLAAVVCEDGKWYAVITREEVNSYNDVMNGTGTGLGTHTVTERVQLG